MNGQDPPTRELKSAADSFLRVSFKHFVQGVKLFSVEFSHDLGPTEKSIPSFGRIAKGMIERVDLELGMLERLRGRDRDFDERVNGFADLRRRFHEEVFQLLAAETDADEANTTARIRQVGKSLTSILRTAELELNNLDYLIEDTTDIAGSGPRSSSSTTVLAAGTALICRPRRGAPVRKAVVSIDLWHYSQLGVLIEAALGTSAVELLNQQIESLIDDCVHKVGASASETVIVTLGDGAILVFDSASQAYQFAEELHRVTADENARKSVEQGRKYFRVGIRVGDIILKKTTRAGRFTGFTMAGMAICDAVRLQARCATGEVLICKDTWAELPQETRSLFQSAGKVEGKHAGEFVDAYRRKIVDPAPGDVP